MNLVDREYRSKRFLLNLVQSSIGSSFSTEGDLCKAYFVNFDTKNRTATIISEDRSPPITPAIVPTNPNAIQ